MSKSAKKLPAKAPATGKSSTSLTSSDIAFPNASGRPGTMAKHTETIYRMSKKIAQLTKVIYFLNTKHEDHSVETTSLAQAYEEEISDVITEATLEINDLSERLSASEQVAQNYEETARAFEEYKALAEQKQTALEDEISSLSDLRERLQQDINDLVDTAEEENRKHASQLRKLREDLEEDIANVKAEKETQKVAFESELETLKNKHVEKIEEMVTERVELESKFEDEREEFRKKTDALLSDHAEEISRLNNEHEQNVTTLRDEHKSEKQILSDQLDDEAEKVKVKNGVIADLQNDVESKIKDIKKGQDSLAESQQTVATKHAQIKTMAAAQQKALTDMMTAKDLNSKYERQLQELQAKFEKECDTSQKILADSKKQAQEMAEMETKFQELKITLAAVKRERDAFEEELKELEIFKERLDAVKAEKEMVRAQLTSELAFQKKADAEKLVTELEKLKVQLTASLTDQHTEAQNSLIHKYEAKLAEHRKDYADLKQALENRLEQAAKDLANANQSHAKEKAELEAVILSLEGDIEKLLDQIHSLKAEIVDRGKEIDRLNRIIKAAETNVSNLELDKADLIQKMIQHDRTVRIELETDFRSQKEQMESQMLKEKKDEIQKMRNSFEQQFKEDVDEAQIQITTKYVMELKKQENKFTLEKEDFLQQLEDLRQVIGCKDQSLSEEHKRYQDLVEAHIADNQKLREEHGVAMEELKKNLDAAADLREKQLKVDATIALSKQEKKHNQVLANAQAAAKKEMDDLRTFNRVSSSALKKELESQRTAEVARLKSEQEAELQKFVATKSREIAELTLDLNIRMEKEVKESEQRRKQAIAEKDTEIGNLKECISGLEEQSQNLTTTIQEHKQEIRNLNTSLNAKADEMEASRAKAKEKICELHKTLSEQRHADLKRMQEEHLMEGRNMLKEFEQGQNFLKKQIALHVRRLEEADIKYENREPREIDLKHIADLEEEIRRKKRKIHGLSDEIDRYKLELNNREDNLNRIFNNKPYVGVMQPLELFSKKRSVGRSESRLPPLYTHHNQNSSISSSTSSLVSAKTPANVSTGVLAPATSVVQQ